MTVEISHEEGTVNGPGHSLLVFAARHPGAKIRLICREAATSQSEAGPAEIMVAAGEIVVAWGDCLGKMPAAIALELLTLDADRVVLDARGCSSPDWAVDYAELSTSLGLSQRLVDSRTGTDDVVAPAAKIYRADAMPVLRRRSIFAGAAESETDDPAMSRLPDQTAGPQTRLRTAARQLAGSDLPVTDETEPRWGAVQLQAGSCQASGVCVQACPTHAIALESLEDRAVLAYDPSLCTGCGLCIQICDANALQATRRLGGAALLAPAQVLAAFDVRHCEKCKTVFRPHSKDQVMCAVCAYRAENPFGSTLPPWAKLPPEIAANWPDRQ